MYYALTTLATVGYGDYYPCSIAEKILGSIIQIFGVTFFSILMNNFIDVVLSMKSSNFNDNEDRLQRWATRGLISWLTRGTDGRLRGRLKGWLR